MGFISDINRKYESEGLLSIATSAPQYLIYYGSSQLSSWIHRSFTELRRDDLLNDTNKDKQVRVDNRRDTGQRYDPPCNMSRSDPRFVDRPRYNYDDQYIFELENIHLIGPDPLPVTSNYEVIAEQIETPREDGYRLKQSLQRTIADGNSKKELLTGKPATCDFVCVLGTRWNNYYHWVVEHLPKLRAVKKYSQHTEDSPGLIVPSSPSDYIVEYLDLFGYDIDNCITWEGGWLRADRYLQPTFTGPTSQICTWLRDRALANISGHPDYKSPDRIYISRRKADGRHITNEHKIEPVLTEFGFETYTTEDLTIPEQITLFSNADVIVGPHGAGLTDLIWMDSGTVIEIFNNFVKPPYFEISKELSHDYYALQGVPATDGHWDGYNSNMRVAPTDLRQLLEEIGL